MKPDPNEFDPVVTEAPDPRAEAAPRKSVDDLLSAFPMRGAVSFSPALRRGMVVLAVTLALTLVLGVILLLGGGATFWVYTPPEDKPAETTPTDGESGQKPPVSDPDASYPFADGKVNAGLLAIDPNAATIDAATIGSSHAVVADVASGKIIASQLGTETVYPASLTKVMTLIVAVECLPRESSLQDTVTISQEIHDQMVAEGASRFGFQPGTTLTVEALLYVMMLKSDGVAACELATYIAGSEKAFVDLMNAKALAMGLKNTHFENSTGLHHPNHKSTAQDLASIMAYAMDMQLCNRILTSEVYRTTGALPSGENMEYAFYHNLLVTQFEKNDPHQPTGLSVIAGKTGYTPESGTCLVTYAETPDGHGYVCVTVNAQNYAGCIRDYITLYNTYAKP